MAETLKHYIDNVPDFPEKGVMFRDITPLLSKNFPEVVELMANLFDDKEIQGIDAFAGVDSRGFIFAAAMAAHCKKQFIMPRKAGKLPAPYVEKEYELEYSRAKLQLKKGQGSIIIVDDVLATGGTLKATAELCAEAGYTIKGFATLIDLQYLNDFSWNGLRARSVIRYEKP